MNPPDKNTYWVNPGLFLAGEYPAAKTTQATNERLKLFLKAGIRCFIDLTQPGESGLRPYETELADQAKALGIETIHYRFGIQDVKIPRDRTAMIDILDQIDRSLAAKEPLYVHCFGGVGRTGTVVGCWLVRHGLTGEEALNRLTEFWQPVAKRTRSVNPKPFTPETEEQRQYILNWAEPKAVRASASPDASSRFRGCLLGLAVGDAVGTTLEFKSPGSFKLITDMVGGGPFGLKPGQWTDDTSMMLCLATSLIECKGFDPKDQMERYVRWWQEGYFSSTGKCFDIGNTVREALTDFMQTGNPLAGSVAVDKAGNGSLMRLAPVPLFFASDPSQAIEMSGESSKTTHATPAAVDACRYMAALIVGALQGVAKDALLSAHYSPVAELWIEKPLCPPINEIAAGSFKTKQPPQIRGLGFVVNSLEAALWAFHHTDNFRDGVLKAVNLGDDADTTGAIYGQLAGAYYGIEEIPLEWREKVAMRTEIELLGENLMSRREKASSSTDKRPHQFRYTDTEPAGIFDPISLADATELLRLGRLLVSAFDESNGGECPETDAAFLAFMQAVYKAGFVIKGFGTGDFEAGPYQLLNDANFLELFQDIGNLATLRMFFHVMERGHRMTSGHGGYPYYEPAWKTGALQTLLNCLGRLIEETPEDANTLKES